MNKLILFLLIVIWFSLAAAASDRAALVNMVTDEIASLEYDKGLTQSYHDDVGRHDIKVRVFSNNNLEGKWVCLVYKVGDSFIEVTEGPAPETRCEQLTKTDSNSGFFDTPDSIKIDDTRGKYPGILYAAVSEDKNIELSDQFIKLNPQTDGWLVGADGGLPCTGSEGIWIYIPEGCNIENNADSVYDSYDITISPSKNNIRITVDAAYYPASAMSAAEIPVNYASVIVGIGTALESILDSTTTKLKEEVKLNYGSYTGKLNVYVNGIKEGEVQINADGAPSVGAGDTGSGGTGGSSDAAAKKSIWDRTESKLKWVFPINYVDGVTEIAVYLKKPVTSASLILNTLNKEELEKKIYEYLNPSSNLEKDNIASVYVKFKIPKQWLYNEFLLHDMVFLNFNKDGWKSSDTHLVKEDREYYYFISWMDNLHDFSIGEKIGDIVPLPEEELAKIAEGIKEGLEQEKIKVSKPFYIWIILLLIFILIILLSRKKKRKKQPSF